jgi:hypothetical protein
MQIYFLLYPLLLHMWWLVHACEGELWTQDVCICIQRQNQIMHTSRGSSTSFHESLWAYHIYLANLCVVIKHQKGGDWKSISQVNDILVFVIHTRVINRMFKCEGLLVNDSEFIDPSKVKRSKHRRPRFLVVYFRSLYYQEGFLDKKLGWNQILHILHPFAIWLRDLCRNPAFGDFLCRDFGPQSRRLRPVKARDFDFGSETPAKESGLPNLFFTRVVQASVAPPESLKKDSGVSEVFAPGSRVSGPYRPKTPGDTGDFEP